MELYKGLGKAFDVMWSASDNLTRESDIDTCLVMEHRLQALRANFCKAEAEGDQAEMLRLAGEMTSFGNDLVASRKQTPR